MSHKRQLDLPNTSDRDMAVNALHDFEVYNHSIQDNLDTSFNEADWPAAEKRLAAELALGTCRHQITLDLIIAAQSDRQMRRIEPLIRQILRVALYQLIYLDSIPSFAAVSEAVKQARRVAGKGASGFVNALLRSALNDSQGVARWQDNPPPRQTVAIDQERGFVFKRELLPSLEKAPEKFLSGVFSHPAWLVERWLKQYSPETVREICHVGNTRPLLTLRPNTLRGSREEFAQKLDEQNIRYISIENTFVLLDHIDPQQIPGYEAGLFSVQDRTAMAVAPRLGVQPGWRVLDLCAAPGGKTTHMAELMNNTGTIIACDLYPEKLARIEENCRRLGITIVRTALAEQLPEILAQGGPFDAILADVPCSNTGVLARRIEARHRLKPNSISQLAGKQNLLLQQAADALTPCGSLLYSTCSIEEIENQLRVERFLATRPDLRLEDQQLTVPQVTYFTTPPQQPPQTLGLPSDGGYTALLKKA